jgi:hypothetical protein
MKAKWESIRYGPLQLAVICMLLEDYKAKRYTSLDDLIAACYHKAHKKKPRGDVRRSLAGTVRHINAKITYIDSSIDRVTGLGKGGKAQYFLKGDIASLERSINANIERKANE